MRRRLHCIILRSFVLLAVTLGLAGCDGLLGTSDRRPNEARVVVTGTGAVPLRLITSTSFSAEQDAETGIFHIAFASFESTDQAPPIERNVRLNTDRFIARLLYPDEDTEANVTMEVYFDGRLVYSQQATLVDSYIDFIHVFQ